MTKMMIAAGALVLGVAAGATCADDAGFLPSAFDAPHRASPVQGAIWYPAAADGTPILYGENPVFFGTNLREGATPIAKDAPVVLLSHGLGGNIRGLGWLAADLAARGAVVVAVNHPSSTTGDMDIRAGLDHGARARDLSAALDTILADPAFGIDATRIMAAGFSYGGWTALSLGGLRGNLDGYAGHCAEVGDASSHCADIAGAGVDLTTLDAQAWNASYADPRITSVVALDPGLHWGLTAADAAPLIGDVTIVTLGDGKDRLLATDVVASGFLTLRDDLRHWVIAPAAHFTTLPRCKPAGAAILKEEGDDPICTDPEGTDRAAVHAQIGDILAARLWP